MLTRRTGIHTRQSVTSHETKRTILRTKDIEQQQEKKKRALVDTVDHRRHGKGTKESQNRRQALQRPLKSKLTKKKKKKKNHWTMTTMKKKKTINKKDRLQNQ
jgi:hypothetical protein